MLTGHGRRPRVVALDDRGSRRRRRGGSTASADDRRDAGERRRVVDEDAAASSAMPLGSPSTSISTPALSLRTKPASPSATRVPVHERAEADALHRPGDAEPRCRSCRTAPQQMRGSGSPTSMSTMRVPPNVVQQHDDALGVGGDLADARRAGAERVRRAAPRGRRRPRRAPRPRPPCPRWRRTAGRCRAGRRRRSRPGRPGSGSRRARRRGPVSRASSLQTVPTPPRVGSRIQRVAGAAVEQRARRARRPARCRSGCRPRARGRRAPASPPCRGRRSCPTRARRRRAARARGRGPAPAGTTPTPGGRDVQPVGGAPADHLRVAGDDRRRRRPPRPRPCRRRSARSSSTGKPSSITNAADSHAGRGALRRRGR